MAKGVKDEPKKKLCKSWRDNQNLQLLKAFFFVWRSWEILSKPTASGAPSDYLNFLTQNDL